VLLYREQKSEDPGQWTFLIHVWRTVRCMYLVVWFLCCYCCRYALMNALYVMTFGFDTKICVKSFVWHKYQSSGYWHQLGSNSTWLDSTRLDTFDFVEQVETSVSSETSRHGGRRTILYKFSRFYALAYTNPICFIK